MAVLLGAAGSDALAQDGGRKGKPDRRPIVIEQQGSFYYGYDTITAPGTYDPTQPITDNRGDIFTIHQGYVFFQIPPKARRYPLVMVHGGGQTGKTYEDFRDRENFQSIFLRRRWSVYIPDFATRGKAGLTTFVGPLGTLLGEQVGPDTTLRYGLKGAFNTFRLGFWTGAEPDFYPGIQFPETQYALEQLAAQSVPYGLAAPFGETGPPDDPQVISDNLAALMEEVGPAVLITHSQSGLFGWWTRLKSENVKAIVSYEPGTFVFPEGELPPPIEGAAPQAEVPLAEFQKLTRVPIQIIYGDFIPAQPSTNPWQERWRVRLVLARHFAEAVNRHGGDAEVLHLPEAGLRGNTHFPFADLNNVEIADLLSEWLHEKGLDRRGGRH